SVSRSVNGLAVLGPLSFVPSSLFNSDDDEGNKELGTRNQELEQPPRYGSHPKQPGFPGQHALQA
ncbi:MAG: hypothetical protein V2A73_00530, partial [Pseudomonadota bacterium]